MRIGLCYRLVLIAVPLFLETVQGQPNHTVYAITAINKEGTEWVAIRKLDTRMGEFSNILLNVSEKTMALPNFPDYKEALRMVNDASAGNSSQKPISNSVAAIAYDKKGNRLYYSPMNIDQLRYIDLSTMQVVNVENQFFSKAGSYDFQTASPITRMVIAPDDYGYTITNDGTHLIRFTTNGAPVLTDLGDLQDAPQNKEMTVHNPCANAGGDLVADNAGQLYLVTASNRVYQVDIASRMTTFLATISGLPQKFATNGAAVDENGKLIISSSVYSDSYFIVDPETWYALPSPPGHEIYGSADLASSNVLLTNKAAGFNSRLNNAPAESDKITAFPNPVLFDEFSIRFNNLPPGNYTIQLTNVLGRIIMQQEANITRHIQTESVHLSGYTAQGLYYIRILDGNKNEVATQKLDVERW